jgi:hypothetical protein
LLAGEGLAQGVHEKLVGEHRRLLVARARKTEGKRDLVHGRARLASPEQALRILQVLQHFRIGCLQRRRWRGGNGGWLGRPWVEVRVDRQRKG